MKKHLITLFVVILATLTHAADLESQLPGYWVPDVEKTYELAKKENRTITRISRGWMPKLGWEFGSGTMLMHIQGNQAVNQPDHFSIKRVDKAKGMLVLEFGAGKQDYTAIFTGHDQLTLSWEKDKFVLNRISKEAFESRFTPPPPMADDITKEDIPATPAKGSVHGVSFTVETATQPDGPWEDYHENGQLATKGNYKNGQKDGSWEYYYADGQLWMKETYKDGKKHGPWEDYHENGQLWQKGAYKDGELDGTWATYDEDGQLERKATFKDGKKID